MTQDGNKGSEPVSPTAFMRQLRPELYSDSRSRSAYQLDASTLEYCLASITSRNQTHDFEIFCRKLCERTICPNLRPATGPEGGGDSKVDTETIPVAEEVATLYVSPETGSAKERWAFAFSAKERWQDKARSDLEGAVGTARGYQKIFFVTSQFARGKARAKLEDELSRKFDIRVTILDRSWIVEQVIGNDHRDLAINYLHVGREVADKGHLGPEDYVRAQHLDELEKQLSDPAAYERMKFQRVTDALVAAKLSRGLERPRVETDGRFARAIRLANAEGTTRQQIAAGFESIWTAYWWYDDIALLNSSYDDFEAHAFGTDHALELGLVGNLLQLLFNSVRHRHLTFDEALLNERAARLSAKIEPLIRDRTRPNNALDLRVTLLVIRVNQMLIAGDIATLSTIWPQFSEILREARGLGEFDAERLTKLIEAFGLFAGDDNNYEKLVDDLAAFVSERTSGARGALVLLRRAEQLGIERNFEMIRLLGRAVPQLMKKEHAESLTEAAYLLAVAYRSAGLLWAARASCLVALANIVVQAENDSDFSATVVPAAMKLAWISIELKHLPDALGAIRLARGAVASLPLTEESKANFEEELGRFDMVASSVLVGLNGEALEAIVRMPDAAGRLGLPLSRMWLLYVLGYEAELRSNSWIASDESTEAVADLAGRLAGRLPLDHRRRPIILNVDGDSARSTSVLGIQIDVTHEGTDSSILVAELALTCIEAAFATLPELGTFAHAARFKIRVVEISGLARPDLGRDAGGHAAELKWPRGQIPAGLAHERGVQEVIVRLITAVLFSTCASRDMAATVKRLVENDSMLDRIVPLATISNSRQRVFGLAVPRMSEWDALGERAYPVAQVRPDIRPIASIRDDETTSEGEEAVPMPGGIEIRDHRQLSTHSIIDADLWDRAGWAGTAFLTLPGDHPPVLALMFRDGNAARSIFEQWRNRVGALDKDNSIYVGIVRGISEVDPAHYRLVVTSLPPSESKSGVGRTVAVVTRSKVMEPVSDENLSRFLTAYRKVGAYLFVPALVKGEGLPEFALSLGILKKELALREEHELSADDFESALLRAPQGG